MTTQKLPYVILFSLFIKFHHGGHDAHNVLLPNQVFWTVKNQDKTDYLMLKKALEKIKNFKENFRTVPNNISWFL